jgi:hypothetical protein
MKPWLSFLFVSFSLFFFSLLFFTVPTADTWHVYFSRIPHSRTEGKKESEGGRKRERAK